MYIHVSRFSRQKQAERLQDTETTINGSAAKEETNMHMIVTYCNIENNIVFLMSLH